MWELCWTHHGHCRFYPKNSEGATYNDGSEEYDMLDDKINPGDTFAYVWGVPERSGPVPETEGSSNVWLYHSHVDETADTYAGLVGPIVVTQHGHADADGKPKDVDREFFAFFQIFDENKSRMFSDNLKKYLPGIDLSLLMPGAMNGMKDMGNTGAGAGMNGMKNMDNTGAGAGAGDDTIPSMQDLMSQDDDTPMILHTHNFEELEAEHAAFYESNRMHSINGCVC